MQSRKKSATRTHVHSQPVEVGLAVVGLEHVAPEADALGQAEVRHGAVRERHVARVRDGYQLRRAPLVRGDARDHLLWRETATCPFLGDRFFISKDI